MTEARSTTEALGQSGASVRIYQSQVVKVGDARVTEQAIWLQTHEAPGLVQVHQSAIRNLQGIKGADPTPAEYSYTMELLHPIPFRSTHPLALASEIAFILERDVWSQPAESVIDWEAFHEYLMDRVRGYAAGHLETFADAFVDVMQWQFAGKLPGCLTHGDPTFANTMLRGQSHVLIDPIPAKPHLPSLRALDVGKIIQSMLGYETRRFGWYFPVTLTAGVINSWLSQVVDSEEEMKAAWFFAAFHFLRLLPYTPPEHYDAMTELLDDAIDWLD